MTWAEAQSGTRIGDRQRRAEHRIIQHVGSDNVVPGHG